MHNKVIIQYTNNRCKAEGSLKALNYVYNEMGIKHPNAFWLRRSMQPGWDGKIHFFTERSYFQAGLLPQVVDHLKVFGTKIEIIDNRVKKLNKPKLVSKFNNGWELRGYQLQAVKGVLNNKINEFSYQRGVINAAVNSGKTLMISALHLSYNTKTLVLLNNSDLFNQFKEELPQILPKTNIKFVKGRSNLEFGDLTIAMVQTLSANIKALSRDLAKVDVILVDEVHLSNNKTYKSVLNKAFNANIRVGLSGSPFEHKSKIDNQNIHAYFGNELFSIGEQELIKKGHSSDLVIKMVMGNTLVKIKKDYREEYRQGITYSAERTRKSVERIKFNIEYGRLPILVVAKYHEHVENLYESISEAFPELKVNYVHHKVGDRKKVISYFKKGKIDILVSSLIIKIGQNMPLIKYMQIAAGGDSAIDAIQILGRAQRKHKSKKKTYVDDFYDLGAYLERHSKHRINYYNKRGFKVIKMFKKLHNKR